MRVRAYSRELSNVYPNLASGRVTRVVGWLSVREKYLDDNIRRYDTVARDYLKVLWPFGTDLKISRVIESREMDQGYVNIHWQVERIE